VTGSRDDLAYVSPRTGRAVTREAARPYADRLLRLPGFLLGSQAGDMDRSSLADGFRLTGHFLNQSVLEPHGKPMPGARDYFADLATR
jgi:DNA repair protein RecO (recombination protein O)